MLCMLHSESGKGKQFAQQFAKMSQVLLNKPLEDSEGNKTIYPTLLNYIVTYINKVTKYIYTVT